MPKLTTWVEIDKRAILSNLKELKGRLGTGVKLMAVVKSNAYGHGLVAISQLISPKVDYLGVVSAEEGLILRKMGLNCPILVLSYWNADEVEKALKNRLILTVYQPAQVKEINRVAGRLKAKAKVHLKVDTGTSRLGVLPKDFLKFAKLIQKLPNLKIEGIFTHLADSENYDQAFTDQQINSFKKLISRLEKIGLKVPLKHVACSASAIANQKSHFNLVRIGLSLYGLWPSAGTKKLAKEQNLKINLKPALAWKTRIIQVKEIPKNTPVGYGCTFKTKRKTKIAILPVGYWDGYDRRLSNRGEVLIQGIRCKILGRVCMNMTMVEVTKIPRVKIGDEAVLIGKDRGGTITADELARKIGTINYEIVTRINPLIPKLYPHTNFKNIY